MLNLYPSVTSSKIVGYRIECRGFHYDIIVARSSYLFPPYPLHNAAIPPNDLIPEYAVIITTMIPPTTSQVGW